MVRSVKARTGEVRRGKAGHGKAVKAGYGTDCQVKVRRVVAVWVWMVGPTFGWVALGMAGQEW